MSLTKHLIAGGLALSALAAVVGSISPTSASALPVITVPELSEVGPVAAAAHSEVIWRAALEVRVGVLPGAATDGHIYAKVNGSTTYLNKASDDFQAGSTATYKLNLAGIGGASTIQEVTLGNTSTDAVCIYAFKLYVDDVVFVDSGRLGTPGGTADCKWLATDRFEQAHTFKRSNNPSAWRNPVLPAPSMHMNIGTAEATIEDAAGSALFPHRNLIEWGRIYNGRAVEIAPSGTQFGVTNVLAIDLDFQVVQWPSPEVDVDLLARFTCSGRTVNVAVSPAPGQSDRFGMAPAIATQMKLSLENRLQALGRSCSTIVVDGARITMH
jgi:hypothetical protein